MTYKYTRKELVKKWNKNGYLLENDILDLLAQKEDKKECEHQYLLKQDHCYCVVCGKSTKPTPSPLDEIEEIEKMVLEVYSDNPVLYELHKKQCEIIDRLNRLVEVIKTLMEK